LAEITWLKYATDKRPNSHLDFLRKSLWSCRVRRTVQMWRRCSDQDEL
jgi:hypothetical protein